MIFYLKRYLFVPILSILVTFGLAKLLFANLEKFNSIASSFLYPVMVFDNNLVKPIKNWFYSSKLLKDKDLINFFIEENQDLKSKIIMLESKLSFLNQTKELTDFSKKYTIQNGILAQIILKNFDSNEHFFIIDAGFEKSVQPDMPVVYKSFLIGRIKEVNRYWSKVMLITDQSCKVAAYCCNSGVKAIHSGLNDKSVTKLDFVNHLEPLLENDFVISSGEGTIFPNGFGLGKIKKIQPDGFNCSVELEPIIDFEKIDYCYVIEKGAEIKYEDACQEVEIKELPKVVVPKKVEKKIDLPIVSPIENEASKVLDIQENINLDKPEEPILQDSSDIIVNT